MSFDFIDNWRYRGWQYYYYFSTLFNKFETLALADSDFIQSAPIDYLLGMEAALNITSTKPVLLKGKPSAWLSSLGWVIVSDVNLDNP